MLKSKSGYIQKLSESSSRLRASFEFSEFKYTSNRSSQTHLKAIKKIVNILANVNIRLCYSMLVKIMRQKHQPKQPVRQQRMSQIIKRSYFKQTDSSQNIRLDYTQLKVFVSCVAKKIVTRKYHGFSKLLHNLNLFRIRVANKLKSITLIKSTIKKHERRLKILMFSQLVEFAFLSVRSQKAQLTTSLTFISKKCKVNMYRVLKTLIRRKLNDRFDTLVEFSRRVKLLQRVDRKILAICVGQQKKDKQSAFQCIRYHQNKISKQRYALMILKPLLTAHLRDRVASALVNVKSHHRHALKNTGSISMLKNIILKLMLKNKHHFLGQLKLNFVRENNDLLNSRMLEVSDQSDQYMDYKETLECTEKTLRKVELENTEYLEKFRKNQLYIQDLEAKVWTTKNQVKKLDRQLKDKDTIVKKLLIEQNRSGEVISKLREDIYALKNHKQSYCECLDKRDKDSVELRKAIQSLNTMLQEYSVDKLMINQMNQVEYCDMIKSIGQVVLTNLGILLNVLSKDNSYRKEFDILNHLKGVVEQLEYNNNRVFSSLSMNMELERYFKTNHKLYFVKDLRNDEISKLSTEILQRLASSQNNDFKLVRAKIVEYSKNSQAFNKQFHKSLQKNIVLKNLLGKVEYNQIQIINYITNLEEDRSIVQKTEEASKKQDYLRILFLDFINNSGSYNKKMLVRDKIINQLQITPDELQVIGAL